ncbi:hypothetical protein MBLNU13_g05379t1 [Cladosporium sp. NU13]
MAKGLRASRTKKNNQALSKRVFGPVEAARNERLSAKLLALAQQPKAPREEMEIEKDTADKEATAEGTPSLSIPIPKSIASKDHHHQLLTPPSTPPTSNNTPTNPILDRAGQHAMAQEQLFFHLLGASSDILGFDEGGDLRLAFNTGMNLLNGATEHRTGRDIKLTEALAGARSADPDAMQDDGADGAPLTRTTTMERSITKQKADRAQKKARIQKRKAAPKPSNAMRFSAKKKTRKGGK